MFENNLIYKWKEGNIFINGYFAKEWKSGFVKYLGIYFQTGFCEILIIIMKMYTKSRDEKKQVGF